VLADAGIVGVVALKEVFEEGAGVEIGVGYALAPTGVGAGLALACAA